MVANREGGEYQAQHELIMVRTGAALTYRWYEGQSGDRSHLMSTGTSPQFETPALQRTTRYWVDVIGECGSTESPAATVAVAGRQRSARH